MKKKMCADGRQEHELYYLIQVGIRGKSRKGRRGKRKREEKVLNCKKDVAIPVLGLLREIFYSSDRSIE